FALRAADTSLHTALRVQTLNELRCVFAPAAIDGPSNAGALGVGPLSPNPRSCVTTGKRHLLRSTERLQIWDTAGQERFRTITQSYYRSANGAIIAYDITKRKSFASVPHWIEDVQKYAGSNIVQLLIGNKSDMQEFREVELDDAKALAEHHEIISIIETSAKDSSNVEEAFTKMATELMIRHGGPVFSEKSTENIKLDSKDIDTEPWGCGC
uniref:RAB43, member RAS onco family n=1 Tax=Leptobrachium leishanense TaxID=445787 RepID=A0A8C5QWX7_9ANUR